jgi:hypothetical protein
MLSNLQIAFALGGKVHGNGVLAPGRGPDDLSLSILPNAADDDYVVTSQRDDDPVKCREYVTARLDRARAVSALATAPRPAPSPSSPPIDFFGRFVAKGRSPNSDGGALAQPAPGKAPAPPTPPSDAPPLEPNLADINVHLYAVFAPAFVAAYPDAKIEVAYADPKTGNAVNRAEIFSAFDLEKAALFAVRKNTAGFNIYVAPALRVGTHKSGRASGDDIITARHAWCEYDGKGDAGRVDALCKANRLSPAIVVTTGTVPNRRDHLYFEIDGVATSTSLQRVAGAANYAAHFCTNIAHPKDAYLCARSVLSTWG